MGQERGHPGPGLGCCQLEQAGIGGRLGRALCLEVHVHEVGRRPKGRVGVRFHPGHLIPDRNTVTGAHPAGHQSLLQLLLVVMVLLQLLPVLLLLVVLLLVQLILLLLGMKKRLSEGGAQGGAGLASWRRR